jgi:hypothetical protein
MLTKPGMNIMLTQPTPPPCFVITSIDNTESANWWGGNNTIDTYFGIL